MKLTMLRKERDELVELLLDCNSDEYYSVSPDLLEDCCKGKRLNEFETYFNSEEEDGKLIWTSCSHERFYNVCREIADLEQKLYKEAFL